MYPYLVYKVRDSPRQHKSSFDICALPCLQYVMQKYPAHLFANWWTCNTTCKNRNILMGIAKVPTSYLRSEVRESVPQIVIWPQLPLCRFSWSRTHGASRSKYVGTYLLSFHAYPGSTHEMSVKRPVRSFVAYGLSWMTWCMLAPGQSTLSIMWTEEPWHQQRRCLLPWNQQP